MYHTNILCRQGLGYDLQPAQLYYYVVKLSVVVVVVMKVADGAAADFAGQSEETQKCTVTTTWLVLIIRESHKLRIGNTWIWGKKPLSFRDNRCLVDVVDR